MDKEARDAINKAFREAFLRVVEEIGPEFRSIERSADSRLEAARGSLDYGEAELAFNTLIENIYEWDLKVSAETKRDLKFMATQVGMLDHAANNGRYW